jgi:hypothetical protein
MSADQRRALMEKALAELHRAGSGYLVFTDADHGDNYAEIDSSLRAEVSHRRWPASKLPGLSAQALGKLDRLGFREAERNLTQSFSGWSLARIARTLESVFLDIYGCEPSFELKVASGK